MRNALLAIAVAATLVGCNKNSNTESTENQSVSTEIAQPATVQQTTDENQLKKYVNWDKPLYTIDLNGDTIEKWTYNNKGLLIKHISPYDNEEFKYDYNNFTRTKINKNIGETSTETYTDDTFKYLAVSSDGVKYDYFAYNVLKSETTVDGNVKTYDYNERGDISRIVSEKYTTEYKYEFDDNGRITSVTEMDDGYDIVYSYTYNDDGTITEDSDIANTTIDPTGRVVSMDLKGAEGFFEEYTYEKNCCTKVTQQRYDMHYLDEEELSDEDTSPTIEYTYYLTQDTECTPKSYFADYKYSLE